MYKDIAELVYQGRNGVLLTIISVEGTAPQKAGVKMLLRDDGTCLGSIGGGVFEKEALVRAKQVLQSLKPELYTCRSMEEDSDHVCGATIVLFIEPLVAASKLIIVGNGHVGSALARVAGMSGYMSVICDDRPLGKESGAEKRSQFVQINDYASPFSGLELHPKTAIIIATRAHSCDLQTLRASLQTEAGFIGLLGSKKKKQSFWNTLKEEGVNKKQLDRVVTPVGLDIKASTPAEIAIAIMAQLIAFYKSDKGD